MKIVHSPPNTSPRTIRSPPRPARDAPHDGAENAPAVQREGGQQVEGAEQQVDRDQVVEDGCLGRHAAQAASGAQEDAQRGRCARGPTDDPEQAGQEKTGQRADSGDEELVARGTSLTSDVRDAAEDKKGDVFDFQASPLCHERVTEFVHEYGRKQQQG